MKQARRQSDRRRFRALAEALEARVLFDGAEPHGLIAFGDDVPINQEAPPAYQITNRWSSTASGGTGATGTGITLTWSVVPDGTALSTGLGEPAANSDLQSRLNALYGSPLTWMPIIQSVFDSWSAISGITFVQDNDDGQAYASFGSGVGSLGVRGDIRLGAHFINGPYGYLAYNWYPDYGDMVIDSDDLGSGGFMFNTANNSRALRNVLAHEIGHGLGLNHVDPVNGTKLMEAFASTGFDGPQFDDMLAINRNYGDYLEKSGGNNTAGTATDRGIQGGSTDTLTNLSLATTSDSDYFKFQLTSTRDATITVTPTGPAPYLQGPYGGSTSLFDPVSQMDLQVQLIASNGTTILQTQNANGVGLAETLAATGLAAGTYYIRVLPAPGATDSAQMYSLSNAVTGTGVVQTTVALDGSNDLTITDTAASGKVDSLTITADTVNSQFVITDPVNFIGTAIVGATGNGTHTVNVPFAAVTGGDVSVSLLAGNDSVSITSALMPIAVDGGNGTDTITIVGTNSAVPVIIASSSGNDTINVNTDATGTAGATFPVSQTIGTLAVGQGGTATLSGTAPNPPAETLVIKSYLKITGNGKLDLKNNDLALNYFNASPLGVWNGSNYTGMSGLIKTGRNGGSWTGSGIITTQTSAIGANSLTTLGVAQSSQVYSITGAQTASFNGQTVDSTTVLVKYTYAGDANLKTGSLGPIDSDDYFRIDSGYSGSMTGYYNGDFNYDGRIDFDDYFVIDSNYNKAILPLPAPPAVISAAPVFTAAAGPSAYYRLIEGDAI